MVIDIIRQEEEEKIKGEIRTTKALPKATGLRATNIRKTSISMPSKLDEMDVLRIDRQNVSRFHINGYFDRIGGTFYAHNKYKQAISFAH